MTYFNLAICATIIVIIATILSRIMHSRRSNNELDSSSSDDEYDDTIESKLKDDTSENELEKSNDSNKGLDTDAVNPEKSHGGKHLMISDVGDIEECLDDYEKVSLIFLLSDNPQDCLNNIGLSKWAKQEMLQNNFWYEKLWEALAVIKNFQVPKKYGIFKESLIEEFFPHQYFTTKYLAKYKKVLYFICENFNEANEKLFIEQLRKDFMKRNLKFIEFPFMEMHFSHLLKIAYISAENTQNCSRLAKTLHMEDVYDLFKYIEEDNAKIKRENRIKNVHLNKQYSNVGINITSDDKKDIPVKENKMEKPVLNKQNSNCSTNISADDGMPNDEHYLSVSSDHTEDNVPVQKYPDGIYNMDGHKLCLIIDQENFYTEIDPQYQHLLPATIKVDKLHRRDGSKEDSKRLEDVLAKRNFQVTIKRNRTHLNLIEAIETFVANMDRKMCSCFFVIILSHGNKDVVYGTNSCHVEVAHIISIMANKKLTKIPKGLILQACQGTDLIKPVDDNLATDGPVASVESSDPKCPNFVFFSSTVPGFASIRDKTKGTWFIQSFCNQIEMHADEEHFMEICTRITREVGTNRWHKEGYTYQMIPYLRTTFFYKLYI